MVTKEELVAEIEKVPEKYLEKLYQVIKRFEKDVTDDSEESVMAKLRQIKIAAAPDFSIKVKLYELEETNEKESLP